MFTAGFQATFRAWDKDGNGKLSKREFWGARALQPKRRSPTPKRFRVEGLGFGRSGFENLIPSAQSLG